MNDSNLREDSALVKSVGDSLGIKWYLGVVVAGLVAVVVVVGVIMRLRGEKVEEKEQAMKPEGSKKVEMEDGCGCGGVWEPVCGEDLITYASECEAGCMKVEVMYKGECEQYILGSEVEEGCGTCEEKCEENGMMVIDEKGCPVCKCIYAD